MALIDRARRVSRFWLPPFLDAMAALIPSLCGGEGCSIFLAGEGRLHLAATTRRNLKQRLFDAGVSYTMVRANLVGAASTFHRDGIANEDSGLTGWVGAFGRTLNLKDIRSDDERRRLQRDGLPMPVWSDRARGFYDTNEPRPFLASPMLHDQQVVGVIRVYTLRANARPFGEEAVTELETFGSALASFLVSHALLAPGLEHYFRIWAAEDGDQVVTRITDAVPRLFNVDCCSYFQCDDGRFVLKRSAALPAMDPLDVTHFRRFCEDNIGNLYYDATMSSKTSLSIREQDALRLQRGSYGRWNVEGRPELRDDLREESSPRFLRPRTASNPVTCELEPSRSKSILLVPVRDVINPRMLAGILRVVSTKTEITEPMLVEISNFAAGLAGCLGDSTRREIERDSAQRLIQQLGTLDTDVPHWDTATKIVAHALGADAVTMFLLHRDNLYRPVSSFLNVEQIHRERPEFEWELHREQHGRFLARRAAVYAEGEGRTGSVTRSRKVLTLKDPGDRKELERLGIQPKFDLGMAEVKDAGPFLAAPIALDASERGVGIIRAFRIRGGANGPFSASHELIAGACATILAGLWRVWEHRQASVIVSYARRYAGLKDELCSFLLALGVHPLELGLKDTGEPPGRLFADLSRQASGAIVIATPDIRSWYRRARPSQNVTEEIGELRTTFPHTLLVLKEERVELPDMAKEVRFETFHLRNGISSTYPKVLNALRQWGLRS